MKKRSSYWQLTTYLLLRRNLIATGFFWVIVSNSFWPILAWIAGQISQSVGSDLGMLIKLSLLGCFVFILQGLAQYGQNTAMAKAAFMIALDLRERIYKHLLSLGSSYFAETQVGDLSYRITGDTEGAGNVINNMLYQFIPSVLQLIIVLIYMIYLNWVLTITVFLVAPIIIFIVIKFGQKLQQLSRISQNQMGVLSSTVIEDLAGIRLIQAFAAEVFAQNKFGQQALIYRNARYAVERSRSFQYPVTNFLQVGSILLIFVLAGWQISLGRLTMPDFIGYLTSVGLMIDPISRVTGTFNELKQTEASVDRIFELLAIPPTIIEKPNAIVLPRIKGSVQYQDVSFGYLPDRPVLENLNLDIKAGEIIALVGTSGAGKSTIANLLMRFYDVEHGAIMIDGIDIRDVTLASLRRQIGIVPQETILFSGTIAENIAFGQSNFDMGAVESAAKIANAHQFISQLSQGYNTWVGERGTTLSGGQKQRLAIARAVFLNPRILLLDEATSALDSESENLVQEALERVMADRTVFIIAHRLATVRSADRILVVENGQIMESGNHNELLNLNGRYAGFYAQQFR